MLVTFPLPPQVSQGRRARALLINTFVPGPFSFARFKSWWIFWMSVFIILDSFRLMIVLWEVLLSSFEETSTTTITAIPVLEKSLYGCAPWDMNICHLCFSFKILFGDVSTIITNYNNTIRFFLNHFAFLSKLGFWFLWLYYSIPRAVGQEISGDFENIFLVYPPQVKGITIYV